MIAYGAALGVPAMFRKAAAVDLGEFADESAFKHREASGDISNTGPFFENDAEKDIFLERHSLKEIPRFENYRGKRLEAYFGIDCGSTTSKFVLLDRDEILSTVLREKSRRALKCNKRCSFKNEGGS